MSDEEQSKPAPPLDAFLGDSPPMSEVFTFKGKQFRFKVLSRRDIEICRRRAVQRVRKDLLEDDLPEDWISIEHFREAYLNWLAIYRLEAAMVAYPGGGPVVSGADTHETAENLAALLSPNEEGKLLEQYFDFYDLHDPMTIDIPQVREVQQAIRDSDPFSLTAYGSRLLIISACTLDVPPEELESAISQIARSLAGGSSPTLASS